jgi:hypothetical protein
MIIGTLGIANGGTGITSAGGVANRVLLTTDGSAFTLGQVGLTNMVTGTLPVGNGGTGATANANSANGVCVLDANARVATANLGSGSASSSTYLAGDQTWKTLDLTTITQVNSSVGQTQVGTNETTILTNDKTITSGKTVFVTASGYANSAGTTGSLTIKLKYGSTIIQEVVISLPTNNLRGAWSVCGIVTGLSGSTTFSVTGQIGSGEVNAYGNMVVLEF